MKLTVKQEHVEKAREMQRNRTTSNYVVNNHCVVAQALKDQFNDPGANCGLHRCWAHGKEYSTCGGLQKQIILFDENGTFTPGEYEIFPVNY